MTDTDYKPGLYVVREACGLSIAEHEDGDWFRIGFHTAPEAEVIAGPFTPEQIAAIPELVKALEGLLMLAVSEAPEWDEEIDAARKALAAVKGEQA